MWSSSKKKPNTLRLFIENPNGVAEYIVGIVHVDETPVIALMAGRVVSGEACDLSKETLQQAIELQRWAPMHADVFEKGRVVYDS